MNMEAGNMTGRGTRAGFTLIEMLVVSLILAAVIGVVVACFAAGVKVWEASLRFGAGEAEMAVELAIVEKDLMNATVFYALEFTGERQAMNAGGPIAGRADATGDRDRVPSTWPGSLR